MPALPPELFDEAIDHLWDDFAALRSCALTCRAWLPSSRVHIFHSVRVRSAADCGRFGAILKSAPAIARCVRRLTLDAEYCSDGEDGAVHEDDEWVDDAAVLLAQLECVTTLGVARVRWHRLRPSTQAVFLALFETVRALFLFEVKFGASQDVLAFLSAFPALSELYFHGVSWVQDSSAPSSQLVHRKEHEIEPVAGGGNRSQLTYLFLDPCSSPTLVTEWLLSHPSEQRLRTIQLCWREIENVKAIGDLLQASGSSLESLQVEFPAGVSQEVVLQNQLSLASNTGLRSLHFGGLNIEASGMFLSHRLFPWVTVMLSQVGSRLLQEVTFELEITRVADLERLDWACIDRELSRDEFRELAVMFYVTGADGIEKDVKKTIASGLAGFLGRGTLSVSCI